MERMAIESFTKSSSFVFSAPAIGTSLPKVKMQLTSSWREQKVIGGDEVIIGFDHFFDKDSKGCASFQIGFHRVLQVFLFCKGYCFSERQTTKQKHQFTIYTQSNLHLQDCSPQTNQTQPKPTTDPDNQRSRAPHSFA